MGCYRQPQNPALEKMTRPLLAILLFFLLSGCAQQYYFNPSLSFRNQAAHYSYDLETCKKIATANVAIPPIRIEYNGPRYVNGTIDFRGDGIARRVNYSGYVYQAPSFNTGFAQGWQVGAAMAAAAKRADITNDCMTKSGWVLVPKIYTPRHGNERLPENSMVLTYVGLGYQDLLIANGNLYLWNPSSSFKSSDGHRQVSIADVRSDGSTYICDYRVNDSNPKIAEVACNDESTASVRIASDSPLSYYLKRLHKNSF